MYTHDDDVPCWTSSTACTTLKKAPKAFAQGRCPNIRDFVDGIVPELDHDRVYQSDLKKLVRWYNLLVSKGAFPLEAPEQAEEAPAEEDPKKEAKAEKKPAKKAAAKKPAAKKASKKKDA